MVSAVPCTEISRTPASRAASSPSVGRGRPAIAAASILAKVHRDRLCLTLHERHPHYGFDGHKGYPTAAHLAALREHGACNDHRRSFAPVRAALVSGA